MAIIVTRYSDDNIVLDDDNQEFREIRAVVDSTKRDDDISHTVIGKQTYRDIASINYNDAKLYYVICDYNKVVSIIKDLLILKKQMVSQTPKVNIANVQIPTLSGLQKELVVPDYLKNEFSDFEGEIEFTSYYAIKWPGFKCPEKMTVSKVDKFNRYCENSTKLITIRWNGDIVPCCFDILSNSVMGNIMETELTEIWNNKKYINLNKSINKGTYFPLCAECKVVKPGTHIIYK